MKNSFIYPIIFMMAVTAIFISVLAGLNFVTADTISFNQESQLQQKILYIFDILPEGGMEKDIERVFNVGSSGMNIIVDKPHNLYLQTAVNTGVLSLISLLFFWGIYLVNSMKIYLKGNLNSYTEYMGAAIFLSITAYLVAGMFNDSIVAVAPLFWILLGMGIGINRMVKDKGHSA
jgi:O-antigen ligase